MLIYYAPDTPIIQKLMDSVQAKFFNNTELQYSFRGFDTEEELLRAYTNSSTSMYAETEEGTLSSTVLAGIVFRNITGTEFPEKIDYSIRFPAALRSESGLLGERFSFGMKQAWFTEILYPIIQTFGPRAKDQLTGGEPGYWSEGFVYVQYAIESELTFTITGETQTILLQRFPYPAYDDDEFLVILQPFLPLVLVLSFLYSVLSIARTLVTEKEKRIHESMKMMGLTNTLHTTASFITFFALVSVSMLLITILLKIPLYTDPQGFGVSVLPKSSASVIYFCLLVHGFQLISFGFFISRVCKTANAAAISSSIIWFMLFLPFPFLQPRYSILCTKIKMVWSLLTNMGICFCCQVFCMKESTSQGLSWNNMFEGVTPDDTFSIGDCIIVMIVNGIVYFVAALYLGIVFVGEFGPTARPWYFFVTREFWGTRNVEMSKVETSSYKSEFHERTPKSLVPGIQIRNLTKTYGEVNALQRLNLTMFQNETFCLLGKNGAGKSSLINVLTGLYPPTSGTAVINSQDIRTNMTAIRRTLGVCPQHNILFDELTVEEHLQFFTTLKGMKGKAMMEEVNRMIIAIGLCHKRKSQVKTLSGGMSRRLCIGIAFCGGSQVIILDEPSTGLDVEARRAIWDLILAEKVGRTVLLSTHFMEEAELLGDRIAILVQGALICSGSSLYLNKLYNGGYNVTVVMEEENGSGKEQLTDFIRDYVPEAMPIRSAGKELTFSLPENKSTEFPALFDAIETQQRELGVESFGARLTSMEDIFIRVNGEQEIEVRNGTQDTLQFVGLSDEETNEGAKLLLQQLHGVVIKKLAYLRATSELFVGQVVIPVVYLGLVLVVIQTIPGIFDPPPHVFELDHYEIFGDTITDVQCADYCSAYESYFDKIRKKVMLVDKNQSYSSTLLDLERQDIAAFNSKHIIGFEEKKSNDTTTLTGFFNNQAFHTPPLTLNAITNALIGNHTVKVSNHPFPYTNLDTQDTGNYWTVGFHVGYNTAFALTFVIAVFSTFLVKERVVGMLALQRISGMNLFVYWAGNFVVDFVNYLVPCAALSGVFWIFSNSTDAFNGDVLKYLILLFLAFGWALIPTVYVMSRCFSIPAVGFAGCGVTCAFSGFITILTITVLELPQVNQINIATVLHRVFLVFPTYALGRGITQLSINKKLVEKCTGFNLEFLCEAAPDSYCCVKMRSNYLDWQEVGIGKNIVYMLCVGVFAIVMLILVESKIFDGVRWGFKNLRSNEKASILNDEDDDVRLERERVEKEGHSDILVIKDLAKSYGPVKAVDNITFGAQEGSCFGLLGTNGAGKSTTFRMLVGETSADSGDAIISSFSVSRERSKTHKLIGYAPQFDALLGELTGRETLVLFARIRGVKERLIRETVENIAKELSFYQYIDRKVEGYSGGNKKKVAVANALIGSPKVVMLDEPSAGMDPVGRRQLWAALRTRMRDKRTCILLTSHSLEECEVMCSRIAIMKNARIQALGSPQQLKHKFGDGFSIVVQLRTNRLEKDRLERKLSTLSQLSATSSISSVEVSQSMQLVDSHLRSHFPASVECELTSSHANYLHYHLKPTHHQSTVSWSTLFRTMETVKDQIGISAYSVSQISLEQVFLNV
ncbi:ATP-binding cassette sub-family A member 3 [Orchesella cincta]|uniref:ATP-binding cassette sub-family A member 3 n=1 Tax=Orchesella cincta TaxID=48709 RepID=A0A1D2MXZ6_ORCCI|nr:ATP-binding cassette sub-family A member 3 [Orchesella cincta]